jgi:hypothetical protein
MLGGECLKVLDELECQRGRTNKKSDLDVPEMRGLREVRRGNEGLRFIHHDTLGV